MRIKNKKERFESLHHAIKECDKCFDKAEKRILLGRGNSNAEIFIIGQSPSLAKKGEGIPFGGETKNIFEKMLQILGENRESVYTTNIVKCTIPHKEFGNPEKCRKFLEIELNIVQPKYVIICGQVAWQECFPNTKISPAGYRIGVDNRIYFYIPHPAAVLRGMPQSLWEMYATQIKQHIQFFRKGRPEYVRIDKIC